MQQPAGATPSAASFDKKEDLDFYSGCAFWLPVGFEYDNAGVISTAQCNAVHPLPDSARRTMARRDTFRISETFLSCPAQFRTRRKVFGNPPHYILA